MIRIRVSQVVRNGFRPSTLGSMANPGWLKWSMRMSNELRQVTTIAVDVARFVLKRTAYSIICFPGTY